MKFQFGRELKERFFRSLDNFLVLFHLHPDVLPSLRTRYRERERVVKRERERDGEREQESDRE